MSNSNDYFGPILFTNYYFLALIADYGTVVESKGLMTCASLWNKHSEWRNSFTYQLCTVLCFTVY